MISEHIKKALIRYITRSATANDLNLLSEWVKEPSNKKEFEDFIKDYYAISYSINEPDTDRAVYKLMYAIKQRKEFANRRKRRYMFKYAAAVFTLVVLLGTYIYRDNLFLLNSPAASTKEIKAGTDKAVLTLADGSEIQLGKKEVFQVTNFGSNGTKLEYFNKNETAGSEDSAPAYHYLTVPKGGKFNIELADGTKVWLNSDSRLKYPVEFKRGKSRGVELIYGEAYFDVAPAEDNQGADFKVYNKGQVVEVLGTEFNIKAYNEESEIYTTLVEGKVTLTFQDKKQLLAPGQQTIYNFNENVVVTKSIDIYNETSWKDGFFSFDNKPLREIMNVLSRWYDVKFNFLNKEIQNEEFIGLLSKNQDIDEILLQIKNLGIINNYKIENNEIDIE